MPPTGPTAPNLWQLLTQQAGRYRDKVAFDYTPDGATHLQITYGELDIRARAIASTLQQQGATGERVLVLCPSGLEFIAGFFGCFYAGAVAVPVHPPVGHRLMARVASIVTDAQARFALTTADIHAAIKPVVDDMPDGRNLQWCVTDPATSAGAALWTAPDVERTDIAFLQYTSGSTRSPKGVVLSHHNLLSNLEAIRILWAHDDITVGVSWLPLHHDMGLIAGILETVYSGGMLYLMPPSVFIERPMRWLETISRTGARVSGAPNFAYELCVERSSAEERAALDLSHWTYCFCGAEPVRSSTIDRFAEAFAPSGFRPEYFHPVYGLAEATLLVSGATDMNVPVVRHVDRLALRNRRVRHAEPGGGAATYVGCGQPQYRVDVVIADPTTRATCGPDEIGEIWVSGPGVAQGYWRRSAETSETFDAFLSDTGRGPFLRTGDLGFYDDDQLFISGRLKDLIVIRGRNHFPEDVESTVQDSHPSLLRGRGAAFAVSPPGSASEELVVVQEVIRDRIGAVDVADVIGAIRVAISDRHEISAHAIVLVEPTRIPTTSSGKVRRRACRDRFLEDGLDVIAQWRAPASADRSVSADDPSTPTATRTRVAIAAWLVAQVCHEFGLQTDEVEPSRQFAHYGLDSVRAVQLTAALGGWLGREISPTLVYDYPTIELLAEHLAGGTDSPRHEVEPAVANPARDTPTAETPATDEPVAIIGIGCRFPGADGPAEFWQLLTGGVDKISEIRGDRWNAEAFRHPDGPGAEPSRTRWGGFLDQIDEFDDEYFGISPRESARMDPQQRLLLEVTSEALDDAGQVPQELAGSRTGVFVGISTYDYGQYQLGEMRLLDAYTGTGSALSIAANRLSYVHDFRGPSIAVDTACSSSLVAVHLACRSLRSGECTTAVAGGVNVILSPTLGVNFAKAGVMAADGRCKTFDERADGYVRGEGAGAVVLKPLSRALADGDPVYAVIRGSAVNQDGRTNGLMAPNGRSQEAVLTEAYRSAGVSPSAVHYVEAHGTGTSLGDAIEAGALGAVLAEGRPADTPCLIGSVKTNIGHLEAAAGVAGLIKVALALRHQQLPPSINFVSPNPHIAFESLRLRVAQMLTPWPGGGARAIAGLSSFGFGGTNAHVVLSEGPHVRGGRPAGDTAERVELLPISARSPDALRTLASRYETMLEDDTSVGDLCFTAGARRGHHDHRLAVVGRSPAELRESLAAYPQGVPHAGVSVGHRRSTPRNGPVFVFSGQGSQWCGMGQRLLAEEPAFRDVLTDCDRAMGPYFGGSVLSEILADSRHERLDDVGVVQPVIFAIQVALAALWREWGVEPGAVVGHSLGEVAAAHVAGALTLDEAARVICRRAQLLRRVSRRGAMVSAEITRAEADEIVAGEPGSIAVAAENSHRSTVLSGDPKVLADVIATLENRGRFCRWINVDVASHSPQMNELRGELGELLTGLHPVSPRVPMYSTLTGDRASRVLDSSYWMDNLSSPVRFSSAIRRMFDTGSDTFVELSPHPLLLNAVREDADHLGQECTLLPSMRREQGDRATMLASLGTLYARGQDVAWKRLHPWGGQVTTLPRYPWQRRRCWLDGGSALSVSQDHAVPGGMPMRRPIRSAVDPETTLSEFEISTNSIPLLAEHRVHGAVLLPAALLLEFVTSTMSDGFGSSAAVLRDIAFHRSLVMALGQPRTVQLILRGGPPGPVLFECYCLEQDDSPTRRWSLLASGTAQIDGDSTGAGTGSHELQAIRARCRQPITAQEFYESLAAHGLEYGPGLQAVSGLHRGDGEAIASIDGPPAGDASPPGDSDFAFGVMDACFQTLAATLPAHSGDGDRDTYVPVAIGEVAVDGPVSEGVWCHAIRTAGADPQPGTVEGDVFLLRRDGSIARSVRGLRLQRISAETPRVAADGHDRLYEPGWQLSPVPHPAQNVPPGRHDGGTWLFFSDGAETSASLRRQLERLSHAGVIVEPGRDFARVGPDAYRIDPDEPQHYRSLFDDVFATDRAECTAVVHMWGLAAGPAAESSIDALEYAQRLGPASVLHLVQAMTAAARPRTPRLYLVTRGVHLVSADDASVAVAAASLWGMGRSIGQECPEFRCTRIDLGATEGQRGFADLVDELRSDSDDTDIALRDGGRHVARLTRYDAAAAPSRMPAARHPTAASTGVFRIEYARPGVLDDVRARSDRRRAPGPDEVEIRIHAAGLNFIDVLRALGSYPGQGTGPVRVGVECAGIVSAVGRNVRTVRPGDAVLALATDGLGSFVTTPAALVVAKPPKLSFEQAAAIPIAFLTAYYALHEQARLRAGERVLIHSAAGGVGLAAIEVARWLGAGVYATAGSSDKRDHLRALGVEHVSDSRSLTFADEVLTATGGAGVDVVLNSLAGQAVEKGLAALAPYGRFVEIGKRDIYRHGRLRLWQLRRNASYTAVDLGQLAIDRPGYVGTILREILALIEQGALRLPPLRTFPVTQTADAVRWLARGTHIGKVAVTVDGPPPDLDTGENAVEISDAATYLITGGCGGLGMEVAGWMLDRGARHLVLTSRGSPPAPARERIEQWRSRGADIVHARADVTDRSELAHLLRTIDESMPPLRGIVHAAGVLDDGILAGLDGQRLRDVMAPKVLGGWNLHALTRDVPLEFFWLFSSAASLLGSPGQAHYAAGNAFLDALAWHRHTEGRPALSIDWGPWATVGLATGVEQIQHLAQHGVHPLPPAEAVAVFPCLLESPATQLAVIDVDWPQWLRASASPAGSASLLAELQAPAAAAASDRHAGSARADLLRGADPDSRRAMLEEYLCEQAAVKLGVGPAGLDTQAPLDRLGLDSLIATELRTQIERELGIVVPIVELLDGPSVSDLADRLSARILETVLRTAAPAPSGADLPDATDSRRGPTAEGAPAPWIDLLTTVADASDDTVDEMLRTVLTTREGDSRDRHR